LGILKQTWERVVFELQEFTVIVITVIAIVVIGAIIIVNTTDFQCAAQFLQHKQFTLLDGDHLLGKHAETACGGTNFKEKKRRVVRRRGTFPWRIRIDCASPAVPGDI
jgi:hypothetical protein